MSNNPFENNSNYKQLFRIRSNANSCALIETVELYKHKTKDYFIIFKYIIDNMTMPIRTILKFKDLISSEVTQTGNTVTMYITTAYNDLYFNNKVGICCGNLPYILQVEKALYDNLL